MDLFSDYYGVPKMLRRKSSRVRARFEPKVPYAIVPRLARLVGAESDFTYIRRADEDEPYPDEWVLLSDDPRFAGYFIPERDLVLTDGQPSPGRKRDIGDLKHS